MSRSSRPARGKRAVQHRERREAFTTAVPKARKTAVGRSTTRDTPLHVRARGFEPSDALQAYVRKRVAFKLGKFGLRISRISVRLEDINGPKGSPGYSCKIKVMVPRHSPVMLTEIASTPRGAFDAVIDSAERSVRKLVDRTRPSTRSAR